MADEPMCELCDPGMPPCEHAQRGGYCPARDPIGVDDDYDEIWDMVDAYWDEKLREQKP